MSKIRVLVATVVLGTAGVISAVPPAGAHDNAVYHTYDYAYVYAFHTRIQACDGESDGHGVRAHWRTSSGDIGIGSWDADGAGGNCADNALPGQAIQFRICENDVGCSAWKDK